MCLTALPCLHPLGIITTGQEHPAVLKTKPQPLECLYFYTKNIFCLGNEDTKLLPNKEQNYTVVPKYVNKENLNASKNDRFLKVCLN